MTALLCADRLVSMQQLYIEDNSNDGGRYVTERRTCEARVSLSRTARPVGGGQSLSSLL